MKMTSNIFVDIESLNSVNLKYGSQLNNRINMEYIRIEKYVFRDSFNIIWKDRWKEYYENDI